MFRNETLIFFFVKAKRQAVFARLVLEKKEKGETVNQHKLWEQAFVESMTLESGARSRRVRRS